MSRVVSRVAGALAGVLLSFALSATALAAGGDTYIVIDGKGETQVITTNGPGTFTVAPGDNPSNQANGTISDWVDKKGVTHKVFHGTLNGEADPKPAKDGWGVVSKVPAGPNIATDFAQMINQANQGANGVSETQTACNGPAIAQFFMDAMSAADALAAKIQASTATDAQKTELTVAVAELKDLYGDLKNLAAAIGNVTNPSIDQLGALIEKFKDFKKKHKKAAKAQKALLEKLLKAGLVPPS